jgi:hypothetical protein
MNMQAQISMIAGLIIGSFSGASFIAYHVGQVEPADPHIVVLDWAHQEQLWPVRYLTCHDRSCVLQPRRGPPMLVWCKSSFDSSSCTGQVAESF